MATAVGASGATKTNSLCEWSEIVIHFDDGSKRILPDITATLRQIMQLAKHPERYEEILAVNDGQ